MSKIINQKTDLNYCYSISPCTIFNFESKPKQKHLLFVSIPMGVYAYQAADCNWSVDVRHSTMFGYVTKNNPRLSPGTHSLIDNYATCIT